MKMWLINNDKFRAVVLFARDDEAAPSAEKGPSANAVEVRKAGVSIKELRDVHPVEDGEAGDPDIPYYVQVVKVRRARATPVPKPNDVNHDRPPRWRWEAQKKEILGYRRAGNLLLPPYVLNHVTGAEA